MTKQESTQQKLLLRTSPGATVPNDLPPEALFILNLGPYLTDETQAFQGFNEKIRSSQIQVLAEKLEEIAEILDDVRMEQLVGTDPDPNDEQLLDEVWEYLNGILTELFEKISSKVDALEMSVNEAR
jgi:hypothetical protein